MENYSLLEVINLCTLNGSLISAIKTFKDIRDKHIDHKIITNLSSKSPFLKLYKVPDDNLPKEYSKPFECDGDYYSACMQPANFYNKNFNSFIEFLEGFLDHKSAKLKVNNEFEITYLHIIYNAGIFFYEDIESNPDDLLKSLKEFRNKYPDEITIVQFDEDNLHLSSHHSEPENYNENYFAESSGCFSGLNPITYITDIQDKNVNLFIELLEDLSKNDVEISFKYDEDEKIPSIHVEELLNEIVEEFEGDYESEIL